MEQIKLLVHFGHELVQSFGELICLLLPSFFLPELEDFLSNTIHDLVVKITEQAEVEENLEMYKERGQDDSTH